MISFRSSSHWIGRYFPICGRSQLRKFTLHRSHSCGNLQSVIFTSLSTDLLKNHEENDQHFSAAVSPRDVFIAFLDSTIPCIFLLWVTFPRYSPALPQHPLDNWNLRTNQIITVSFSRYWRVWIWNNGMSDSDFFSRTGLHCESTFLQDINQQRRYEGTHVFSIFSTSDDKVILIIIVCS